MEFTLSSRACGGVMETRSPWAHPKPIAIKRALPAPLAQYLAVGLLSFFMGCSGGSKPTVKADPTPEAKKPKVKDDAGKKEGEESISKPLKIRRLKRDPRSVVDHLEDLKVLMIKNSDGNVSAAKLESIDDETLTMLARLEELKELTIAEAEITKDALNKLFGKIQLHKFEIHGQKINSQTLEGIVNQHQLKTLRVSATRVDDKFLKRLAAMKSMEHLELAWSRVTSEGLEHLDELTKVKTLDLSFTDVGDESVEALKKFTNLETLILSGTAITEEAGKKLAEALKDTHIIGLPSNDPLPPPPPAPDEPPAGLIDT